MKNLLLGIITVLTLNVAQAQTELKINPLGAIFGRPEISAEFLSSESFGVELSTGVLFGKAPGLTSSEFNPKQSGFGIKLAGKYYLNPENAADGWYTGLYLRQQSFKIEDKTDDLYAGFKRSIFAIGIDVGKKWVSKSGFIVEAGMGFGKALSEKNEWLEDENTSEDFGVKFGVDFTAKFAIGYRLGESGGSNSRSKSKKRRPTYNSRKRRKRS